MIKIQKLPIELIKLIGRPFIYFIEGIKCVSFKSSETLFRELKEFQNGKTRLIVAFRHPTRHDPPVIVYSFLKLLYKRAKMEGIKLNRINHCHYLYGSWVLMWANGLAKWLFPGMGAIPVSSRGMNIKSIKTIRDTLLNGKYPLALAPEGQVNYHNGQIETLEPGLINMAAWCREDLNRTDSKKDVRILPLTLYYHYPHYNKTLKEIYKRLNKILKTKTPTGTTEDNLYIYTKDILRSIENKYIEMDTTLLQGDLQKRVDYLTDIVLKRAEELLSKNGSGSHLNRIVTIRATIEDQLLKSGKKTHSAMRHMEVADILEYITPSYINNCDDKNRYIEYGLNLLDLHNRLMGGNISTRWSPHGKEVYISSGNPIEYRTTRSKNEKREQFVTLNKSLTDEFIRISR